MGGATRMTGMGRLAAQGLGRRTKGEEGGARKDSFPSVRAGLSTQRVRRRQRMDGRMVK